MLETRQKVYCAFCKSERMIPKSSHVTLWTALGLGVCSLVLMFAVWMNWNPRALLVWVVLMMVAEIHAQFRWRLSLICRRCGFDPVVYKGDIQKAAGYVRARFEARRNDPLSALRGLPYSSSPTAQIPSKDVERTAENAGTASEISNSAHEEIAHESTL